MPVLLDTHDPDLELRPGTTKSGIVAFLYKNPEYGYRPAEVTGLLDIPHGTATTTLNRLHDDGCLGKTQDGYYYALDSREDLHRYVSSLDQLEAMFRQPVEEEIGEGESISDDGLESDLTELEADLEI